MLRTTSLVLGLLAVLLLVLFPAVMISQTRGAATERGTANAAVGGNDVAFVDSAFGGSALDARSRKELAVVEKHMLLQFEMAQSVVEQQLLLPPDEVPAQQARMDADWLQALRDNAVALGPVSANGARTSQLIAHANSLIERLRAGTSPTAATTTGATGSRSPAAVGDAGAGAGISGGVDSTMTRDDAFSVVPRGRGASSTFEEYSAPYGSRSEVELRGSELTYAILTGGNRRNVIQMVATLTSAGVLETQIRVLVDCKHCFNASAARSSPSSAHDGYNLFGHFEVIAELGRKHPGVHIVPVDLERNHRVVETVATPTEVHAQTIPGSRPTASPPRDTDRTVRVEVYTDHDVPGHDVVAARGVALGDCVRTCADTEHCTSAAFVRGSGDCWMKDLSDPNARGLRPAKGVDLVNICDATANSEECPLPDAAHGGGGGVNRRAAIPFALDSSAVLPEERVGEVYFWLVRYLFNSPDTVEPARFGVVLEDDYTLSPDVHNYYTHASFLLDADPSLFCATGHAEHAMEQHARDPGALLRTEYFPVLAWMTSKKAFDKWLRPVMPADQRFGGFVTAGGQHSGHWDHFIKQHVFRPPGEGGRKDDAKHPDKFAQAVYAEVPRVVHRMEDGASGAVSTSSGMQRVFYSPVKLQGSLYSGNFLSIDAVVNFETFLAAVISEADAVLVDATCVNEVFVLRENSTFVILLSSVTSESQAAWDHVLQPLQLWFTFNIFKGTFVTQWQGQRLVFVAAYSPLYRVAQAAVRPAPQQAQAQQALIRGAASASAAVEALGSVPHVAVNKADDTRTAFGQCAAAFSRAGLNPREEFSTALSHGGSQLARRPVLALTGPGAPSCAAACAKLRPDGSSPKSSPVVVAAERRSVHHAFSCDDDFLMRLNACTVADVAHLFDLAAGRMVPMLDAAAKGCVGGHGGFNGAINTNPGEGPGFSTDRNGKLVYHVILHRFLSCNSLAADDTELICPCTALPATPPRAN